MTANAGPGPQGPAPGAGTPGAFGFPGGNTASHRAQSVAR